MVHTTGQVLDRPAERDVAAIAGTAHPVTMMASFSLLPGHLDVWRDTWKEIGRKALLRPSCHDFRLLVSRSDDGWCSAVSTWDDVEEFHRFVREIGLLWIERSVTYSDVPTAFTYCNPWRDAHVDDLRAAARYQTVPLDD